MFSVCRARPTSECEAGKLRGADRRGPVRGRGPDAARGSRPSRGSCGPKSPFCFAVGENRSARPMRAPVAFVLRSVPSPSAGCVVESRAADGHVALSPAGCAHHPLRPFLPGHGAGLRERALTHLPGSCHLGEAVDTPWRPSASGGQGVGGALDRACRPTGLQTACSWSRKAGSRGQFPNPAGPWLGSG